MSLECLIRLYKLWPDTFRLIQHCITVSWTNPDILDSLLSLLGYTLLTKDRIDTVHESGGGFLMYVTEEIEAAACEDID